MFLRLTFLYLVKDMHKSSSKQHSFGVGNSKKRGIQQRACIERIYRFLVIDLKFTDYKFLGKQISKVNYSRVTSLLFCHKYVLNFEIDRETSLDVILKN